MNHMRKIHDRIIIPCDDDKVISGTIVGTATTIVDPSDVHHPGSNVGMMHQNYVIRLDYEFTGWLGKYHGRDYDESFIPVQPLIPIEYLVVHEDNVQDGPWYVNVYEVDQGYGGPEEGGWYYYTYAIQEAVRCETYAEAERLRKEFQDGKWADDPDARISSVVYSGGVYSIVIEATVGEDSDTYQPYR